MFDLKLGTIAKLTLASSLLFAASCASNKPPERGGGRGGPQQGNLSMMGYVAQPISLLFVSMDKDQDGMTSIVEMNDFTTTQWANIGLEAGRELRSFGYQTWAITHLGSAEAMPSFIGFDTDLSGSISQLEFETCLRRNFDLLDKDKNGLLSRAELIVRMPSMQDRGNGQGRSGGKGEERGKRPQR
ncbi:EF-hand domain-containing protein [Hirschia baltica]|uniref:Putative signal transduction protein with EFhand domain n=1 Tax=Hirschia baltica (strain ATCC 49814 / DSM 5838 / IFAM 1418) TaxID=582402 RepID=C6XKY0_HIRBI|nr:signal transduction protein with EFhand domain [Hirschia baltica]ACT57809.1 putative signal transduction protein with EFhand domain [Hirschia baltica ATCC 49814]